MKTTILIVGVGVKEVVVRAKIIRRVELDLFLLPPPGKRRRSPATISFIKHQLSSL